MLTSRHGLPITAASSISQSSRRAYAGIATAAPGPTTDPREVLMKCQGLRPRSCGSPSSGMFMTFAISAMWSV